ncbi:DUF397 domain-containing protein [Kitasatospora acidiphila]|uniref:DUF397 domain-containing protein n=1 Tax=Kitasatospora acidiphila TaxID=2567942 RepID=UPI003C7185FB
MTFHPNAAALGATWTKATQSNQSSNCVEAASLPGQVAVRDSKNPTGPAHVYSPYAFAEFTAAVGNNTLVAVN